MSEVAAVSIGLVVVAFRPDAETLIALIGDALSEFSTLSLDAEVFVWANSPLPPSLLRAWAANESVVIMTDNERNLGFGGGVNRVIEQTQKDWYVVLNQDLRLMAGALGRAVDTIRHAAADTAVLEFAHRPFEHPKEYDPVSRETPWFSGAAFCVSRAAFLNAGGFDRRFFMYGEDVDLSFKFRLSGWRLIYMPNCIVFHEDIVGRHGQKPLQEIYDRSNNILLRIKYGSLLSVFSGILWLIGEGLYFLGKGRKIDVLQILSQISKNATGFWKERGRFFSQNFYPGFDRWRYCRHRLGARYRSDTVVDAPKVSVIVRTMNRPKMLMEALRTALAQTYRNVEVVVIDDGAGHGRHVVEELRSETDKEIRYIETSGQIGRAAAGNAGLANCTGEFICFLDEDDQLYADHVEVLVGHSLANDLEVSYAIAEEVASKYVEGGNWIDGAVTVKYCQKFSRVLLWYKNYIPIQSALFSRSLYEELGGFDETVDLYEDWSLWVKYSTKADFGFVPKITSRYRVFTDRNERSRAFDDAYLRVAAKHTYPGFAVSPVEFREMVDEYIRMRGVLCVTREGLGSARRKLRSFFAERRKG